MPEFYPLEKSYEYNIEVTIKNSNNNLKFYYTTDGKNPDQSSAEYTDPIPITNLGTKIILKAISINEKNQASEVAEAEYKIYIIPDVYHGYDNDSTYKKWIIDFYEGTPLAKGWHTRKEIMLEWIDDNFDETAGIKIDELGRIIGTEWAKHNDIRKINKNHVTNWWFEIENCKDLTQEILEKLDEIKNEAITLIET